MILSPTTGVAPAISVVIPTFNRRPLIERTLPTVLNQDFASQDFEVLVVDDGSDDGTAEWLKGMATHRSLQVLRRARQGKAAAMNAGIAAARGAYILFLDDDLVCEESLLRHHRAAHSRAAPSVVFGVLIGESQRPPDLVAEWLRRDLAGHYAQLRDQGQPSWPEHAWVGPNCSLSRRVLLNVGGYDEAIPALEDFELGLRLWKEGLWFHFQPLAVVRHLSTKTVRQTVLRDAPRQGQALVHIGRKVPQYRAHSPLGLLATGPAGKRLPLHLAVRLPVPPDALLELFLRMAESLSWLRSLQGPAIGLLKRVHTVLRFRGALREAGSWQKLHAEYGRRLPVLLYHRVGSLQPGPHPELSITPGQFERQIAWLARRGYRGIRPSEWLAWLREGRPLPEKPVLLTFDDAYAELAETALPVLHRNGFGAVVFVVTQEVGGTNRWDEEHGVGTHRLMTADQIKEWAAQGIEFGAHSRTHTDLTRLSEVAQHEETAGSGAELAGLLGSEVTSFAYPYGLYDEATLSEAQKAFRLAFGCEEGLNTISTDPFRLKRTMVLPSDSLREFGWRVRHGFNPLFQLRTRLRLRARIAKALERQRGHAA